jgi:CRP-like cAMP-binding protein
MAVSAFQNFLVRYGAGERIFTEGDLGTTMYVVQSGKVQLFRIVDDQRRVHGVMEKGDFFGEMSILEGLPRTVSAEATEDAELIEINSMTFDKMIKSNIEIAIRMLRKLSIRLREAERRIETMQPGTLASAASRGPAIPQRGPKSEGTAHFSVEGDVAVFSVSGAETLIGRYDPVTELMPDVDLTQVDLKRSVSRRHARITRTGDGYALVEEVGALNGTFVNGQKLVAGRPQPIEDGDRVSCGMVKLVFHAAAKP